MTFSLIYVALKNIKAHFWRNLLIAFSLLIGVLAVIIIQAGAYSAKEAVVANAILANGKTLTVSLGITSGNKALNKASTFTRFINKQLSSFSGKAVVTAETGFSSAKNNNINLILFNGELRKIRPFPLKDGKWPHNGLGLMLPVVLNEPAKTTLNKKVGAIFTVKLNQVGIRTKAVVVGVIKDGQQEANAYSWLDPRLFWVKELALLEPLRIFVHVENVSFEELRIWLQTEYKRIFAGSDTPEIVRVDTQETFTDTLTTMTLIFFVIAILSLVVGALGILNIGLATLKERSDELSLRRAFGATKFQAVFIIILEGQIIALGAAIIALVVGRVSFFYFASYFSAGVAISHPSFPYSAAVLGILASALAAFLGSISPAIRAARVSIASIMRL